MLTNLHITYYTAHYHQLYRLSNIQMRTAAEFVLVRIFILATPTLIVNSISCCLLLQ
jgi:hypothetical protein